MKASEKVDINEVFIYNSEQVVFVSIFIIEYWGQYFDEKRIILKHLFSISKYAIPTYQESGLKLIPSKDINKMKKFKDPFQMAL